MNLNKISLIAAVAALMLTGCNNDLVLQSEASDKAIEFRTVMDKTRASLINSKDELTSFFLHAGEAGVNDFDFMNVAAYKDDDGWTYAPKKYWPGYALDFFAYAPIKAVNMGEPTRTNGTVNFSYEVPYDQSESNTAVDLLVAHTPNQAGIDDVPINFEHALSSVIFSAKNNLKDLVFTIHSIEITNLNTIGTYTTNNSGSWINHSDPEDYIAGIPESGVAVNPGQNWLRLLSLNDYLMVLPQSFESKTPITNDVAVKVVYSAMYQDGNQVFDSYTDGKATVYFSLSQTDVINKQFAKGTRYNFKFVLGDGSGSGDPDDPTNPTNPNEFKMIELYVTVEGWVGYDDYKEDEFPDDQNGTQISIAPIIEN